MAHRIIVAEACFRAERSPHRPRPNAVAGRHAFSSTESRKMLRRSLAIAMPLLAALTAGALAYAAPPPKSHGQSSSRASLHSQQMSLEHAVEQVQTQTKGRILAADTIPSGRNKLYRIKVLTPDGHVRVMQLHSNDVSAGNGGGDQP